MNIVPNIHIIQHLVYSIFVISYEISDNKTLTPPWKIGRREMSNSFACVLRGKRITTVTAYQKIFSQTTLSEVWTPAKHDMTFLLNRLTASLRKVTSI